MGLFGSLLFIHRFFSSYRVSRTDAMCVICILYMSLLGLFSMRQADTIFAFLVEFKIVFLLPLVFLFSWVRRRSLDAPMIPLAGWTLIAFNAFFFAGSGGLFRYVDFVASGTIISIYMSIALAMMFLIDASITRRIIYFIFMLFLGSTTGLAALVSGLVVRKLIELRKNPIVALVLVPILVAALFIMLYQYTLVYRGRDIFDPESIDRFQILFASFEFFRDTATVWNLVFGYGVGVDLSRIMDYMPTTATVLPWLLNSRAADGFFGLAFHNEFLRIFVAFGLIGSVLFWGLIFRAVPDWGLRAAILGASVLNSTVYTNLVFAMALLCALLLSSARRHDARVRMH